ncbi:MAG: DinB family protein [Phycisphaerales bacterium]|nr:DinB family protein [Phycisphaerales bacterium]
MQGSTSVGADHHSIEQISRRGQTCTLLIQAIRSVLAQLREALELVSDAQYTTRPVGNFDSSIGGHVRHCLDHIASICSAQSADTLDYDLRERGTAVECDRSCALREIDRLSRALEHWNDENADRGIRLAVTLSGDGARAMVDSTLGRELAFVHSHTIHHNATIASMARTLGAALPDRFGYAPATLAYLRQNACAPSPSSA